MKLQSRSTHPVAAAEAFRRLRDFDALTEFLRAHGVQIAEYKPGWPDGTETRWRLGVGVKGLHRDIRALVTEVTPEESFTITVESDGIHGEMRVVTRPEGADACTVDYAIELGARGLGARMMLQPLILARGTIEQKLHNRLTGFTRQRLGL